MRIVSPNWPVILFMLCCFIFIAAIVTGIVLIVVYSMKGTKTRRPVYVNPDSYQHYHSGNHYTGHSQTNWQNNNYQPPYMHSNMTTPENSTYSDVDHDGIPDQFDNHDNRFDSDFSHNSAGSFDHDSNGNDSSSDHND